MTEYKVEENIYKKLTGVILPMGLVQLSLTILSLIFWFVSKYKLYYVREKEKYYISHRKGICYYKNGDKYDGEYKNGKKRWKRNLLL